MCAMWRVPVERVPVTEFPMRFNMYGRNAIVHGDCLDVLKRLPDNTFTAIVTDPPYGLSNEPDMREVLEHWLAGDDYEHRGSGFMGKCYHPDTDVLTADGWRPVAEIKVGDLVCSLNPETREIQYVRCSRVFGYAFEGSLLHIHGRSIEQLVTPNHNVVIEHVKSGRLELRRADQLPAYFRVVNQGLWRGKKRRDICVEGAWFPIEHFLRFLGLFIGDGYTVTRRSYVWKQDFFGFTVFKEREKSAVREAASGLGLKFSENPFGRGQGVAFYFYNKSLLRYLKRLGHAKDKHIPASLFGLDSGLLEHLYRGLLDSDGTEQGYNRQHVYYTASERLADDFQRLCLHTGRSCVKTRKQNSRRSFKPFGCGWVLSVTQSGKRFWLEKVNHKKPSVHNCDEVAYEGAVHCVQLESNHILLSRFNGRTVWSGNSWDSFVPGPKIWEEVMRVLKPGGHILSFSGSRTYDLMVTAMRLAGSSIRDKIDVYCSQSNYMGWAYGCLSEDTEVITPEGAKPGMNVRVGEPIECWEPETGNIVYLPVLEKFEYPFEGEMVSIRSEWTDQLLTPNHRVYRRVPHSVCESGWRPDEASSLEGAVTVPTTNGVAEGLVGRSAYKGTVWCVRVATGAFVARRNGKYFVTGNSGFPKSMNIGKALDKKAGHFKKRGQGRTVDRLALDMGGATGKAKNGLTSEYGSSSESVTDEAKRWEGYGTALKPAHEPIAVFTKEGDAPEAPDGASFKYQAKASRKERNKGCRELFWVLRDNHPVRISREEHTALKAENEARKGEDGFKAYRLMEGNIHPCVKPLELCRYLVRMVKMPGDNLILDPFMGSGSVPVACILEGCDYLGIDSDDVSYDIARARTTYFKWKGEAGLK